MRKYSKSRQISRPATVILSPDGNQTIGDRVRKILSDNSPLSSDDWFLLTQVHLVCLFRRARAESRKKKNTRYITKREDGYLIQNKGKENSLTSQDFLALNQWITNQDLADKQHNKLEALIKRVKQRKKQAKREVKS